MNSRRYFEIMPSEGEKKFTLPVNEHQVIFQRYLDMTYHVQELDQLYRMMLYNLEKIFRDYDLLFDDRVYTYNGQEVDVLQLNALIGNAISSARTLIESVEVFDKAYIDSDGTFKTYYISKAYDKWMAYRMVDFLRNYMQHGHVPISYDGIIIAIGIGNIPSFARVVRGEVHIVKNEEYCNACRVIGVSNTRLLFTHILPNAISPIIVYATLNVASAIISEAALSFLGLGIAAPTASWGSILREGKSSLTTAPFVATISGAFILITVLGFNLFGDGIRDVLDPKMKQ